MLDFRTETFLKLCDTMNYRAAAEELNMSQPAVTQHIHRLENEYGCKLFIYDGQTLHKTAEAAVIEKWLRAMYHNQLDLKAELAKVSGVHLKIGATKTIGEFILPQTAVNYLTVPENTLTFTVENTQTLLRMLDRSLLDFAVIEGYFDKADYGSRFFCSDELTGICAHNHPFAGREIDLEDTFPETLIIREEGSGTREVFENILSGFCVTVAQYPRVVCVNNFYAIQSMVALNAGISFVFTAVAKNFSGLATFRLKHQHTSKDFYYVFLKNAIGVNEKIDLFENNFPNTK